MFKSFRILTLALCIVAVSAFAFAEPIGRPNYAPLFKKVDSFSFVVDASGSMMMGSNAMNESKITVAKFVMGAINARMPQLDYMSSLFTLAPDATLMPSSDWNRGALGNQITKIPSSLGIYGRLSPLGAGINSLQSQIASSGSNAIVLFTDGWNNLGANPVQSVQALMQANPSAQIHIVSFATPVKGEMILNNILALGSNVSIVKGSDLLIDPCALDTFIKNAFYVEGDAIVNDAVYFKTGSYELDGTARATLDKLAMIINNVPRGVRTVEIEGFTDTVGSYSPNVRLSDNRAKAVRAYLIENGSVPESKVYVQGNSYSYIYNNSKADGRQLNRRTSIIIN